MRTHMFVWTVVALLGGVWISGCHDQIIFPDDWFDHHSPQDSTSNNSGRQDAIDKALDLFPGTVREVEHEREEGIDAWKVDIINDKGAEVEIYCRKDNGKLLRIDGESGPFDYNIEPPSPLISFEKAKEIGDAEVNDVPGRMEAKKGR